MIAVDYYANAMEVNTENINSCCSTFVHQLKQHYQR